MQPYEVLEKEFSLWAGVPNTVSCSSGSSALHLALEAFNLPVGSEVLVPEFTMVACARAVTMAGLKPVFVDCNDSLLMDPEKCSQAITLTTRVIMPVHIYGRSCDMQKLGDLADACRLKIVEDCAEFHGGSLSGRADASCWSFYLNKIVHGDEGGMVAFKNRDHAEFAKMLRCQGFTAAHDFIHVPRGINARMSNANANAILPSLRSADINIVRRSHVAAMYDAQIPEKWKMPKPEVYWVYDIRMKDVDVYTVVETLNRYGVAARRAFRPMSEQPEYQAYAKHLNAYRLSREVLYLPVTPDITEEQVEFTVNILKKFA